MSYSHTQLLKETIVFVHNLTSTYLRLLKDTNSFKHFEINGNRLNNLYWITAHIAYFEDLMLSKALGFQGSQYKWLNNYGKDSPQQIKNIVSYTELTQITQKIHVDCLNNLDKLTDKDLEKDNYLGFKFGKDASIKAAIKHHIRHEGVHAGHLSILCKLNGIKTF